MATVDPIAVDLVSFLNASPTNFHAVGNLMLPPDRSLWSITIDVRFLIPPLGIAKMDFFFHGVCYWFVDEAKKRLKEAGFTQLSEREDWVLKNGKKYFFTRNYSTIVAFAIGKKWVWLMSLLCASMTKDRRAKLNFGLLFDIECNDSYAIISCTWSIFGLQIRCWEWISHYWSAYRQPMPQSQACFKG